MVKHQIADDQHIVPGELWNAFFHHWEIFLIRFLNNSYDQKNDNDAVFALVRP